MKHDIEEIRKGCALNRLPNQCSIYNVSIPGCRMCGHNKIKNRE